MLNLSQLINKTGTVLCLKVFIRFAAVLLFNKTAPSEEKYILNQISTMKDKYKVENSKFKYYICMKVRNRRYSYKYNSKKKKYTTSCFENNTYRPY